MLKIATWYESSLGRNDGNPLYVTGFLKRAQYFCDVKNKRPMDEKLIGYFPNGKMVDPLAEKFAKEFMEKHDPEGLKVEHLRPFGDVKSFGKFDINLWVDWGEDALTGLLPYKVFDCPKPMVYWASDTHIQNDKDDSYPYRLSMAKKADFAFCAQIRGMEQMKADGVDATWLPHAVEPIAYPKQNFASKSYDTCFVGHINTQNRIEALDAHFKQFSKGGKFYPEYQDFFFGQRRFEKAAEIYGKTRIVFNIAMTDDINMRTFEAMGTGSFLLTNDLPTMGKLFEDGKHLGLYSDEKEMIDKTEYYLKNPIEREKIAKKGYEEVIKNHTFYNRMTTMFDRVLAKELVS